MALAEILSDIEYWQSLCLFQVEHSRFHSPPKEKGACSFQSPAPCRCRSGLEGPCPFLCPAQPSRPDLNLTTLPKVQQREPLLAIRQFITYGREPGELKHLSTRRKRKKHRFPE